VTEIDESLWEIETDAYTYLFNNYVWHAAQWNNDIRGNAKK